jgi:hypothetical protein
MALATQDYIDSVPLVHRDDWAAITAGPPRSVASASRLRLRGRG